MSVKDLTARDLVDKALANYDVIVEAVKKNELTSKQVEDELSVVRTVALLAIAKAIVVRLEEKGKK